MRTWTHVTKCKWGHAAQLRSRMQNPSRMRNPSRMQNPASNTWLVCSHERS